MSFSWNSISARFNRSRAGRHIVFALKRLFDEVALPILALKRGHILLLGYTIGISALTVWATLEMNQQWYEVLLRTRTQTGFTILAISRIWFFGALLVWACSLPIICTAVALPLRILWARGNLANREIVTRTLPSIRFSSRALGLALRIEVYHLVPLMAMIIIYFAFVRHQDQLFVTQLYSLGLFGVCISTAWKSLPVLLSPLLAVVGQFDGRDATRYSGLVFRPRGLEFIIVVAAMIGMLIAIYLKFHGHTFIVKRFSTGELIAYAVCCWYGLAILSFKTMQAVAAATAASASQPAQSPQTTEQSAAGEPQRPVINIQNLWVTQDENGGFKIKNPQ